MSLSSKKRLTLDLPACTLDLPVCPTEFKQKVQTIGHDLIDKTNTMFQLYNFLFCFL
jgi:hypothetical protein